MNLSIKGPLVNENMPLTSIEEISFLPAPGGITVRVRLAVKSGSTLLRSGWREKTLPAPLSLETILELIRGHQVFKWPEAIGQNYPGPRLASNC